LIEENEMTNSARSTPGEFVEFPVALQSAPPAALSVQARQHFQEGIASLQSGEAAEAVAAFSRSIEHAPEFTDAHVFLGIAHALTYNIYPAIDHLETAAKLDHDSFAAHFTLAQLSFKLRTPQKGYAAAKLALRCATTVEQRKMLTQLLREERARERNGIARPSFSKSFSLPVLLFFGSALAALIIAAITHIH
jgi:tetratricopeptide (TPR) repeat protein